VNAVFITLVNVYDIGVFEVAKHLDPVCGMLVDSEKTRYKTVYKGRIYYFCSKRCLSEFEKNPEHYLTHGPQGMP
jgi:YHS domain-containing protein